VGGGNHSLKNFYCLSILCNPVQSSPPYWCPRLESNAVIIWRRNYSYSDNRDIHPQGKYKLINWTVGTGNLLPWIGAESQYKSWRHNLRYVHVYIEVGSICLSADYTLYGVFIHATVHHDPWQGQDWFFLSAIFFQDLMQGRMFNQPCNAPVTVSSQSLPVLPYFAFRACMTPSISTNYIALIFKSGSSYYGYYSPVPGLPGGGYLKPLYWKTKGLSFSIFLTGPWKILLHAIFASFSSSCFPLHRDCFFNNQPAINPANTDIAAICVSVKYCCKRTSLNILKLSAKNRLDSLPLSKRKLSVSHKNMEFLFQVRNTFDWNMNATNRVNRLRLILSQRP